ncbi:MAG: lysylphosphatidylglycerol synthase transmembrane domain-containing protein [Desulfuromonadales bacterium]
MNRYRLVQALTWLFSLALVLWIGKSLPLTTILDSVSGLSLTQWALWSVLNLVIILVYVQRWRCLSVAAGLDITFNHLFLLRQAGQLISFITPGPQFGGEPLQVYWLWKKFSASGTLAILSVALDRFFELWINFAVLLLGLVILMLTPALGLTDLPVLATVLALMILVLSWSGWFLISHQEKVSGWIKKLAQRWQHNPQMVHMNSHWDDLGARLRRLIRSEKPSLNLALFLSLLGWAGMIFEVWLLLKFFAIEPGLTALVLLVVAMRLAFLLPLPGGVGTLEAAIFWAFTGLGLPLTGAAAAIAMMRLRDIVVLLVGLFALRRIHQTGPAEVIPVGGKE